MLYNIFKHKNKKHEIPEYIIFSVSNFNKWFNSPKEKSYANKGIFLRIDKLSLSFLEEYFKTCYNLDIEKIDYIKVITFENAIKTDWNLKLNGK